MKNKEIEELLKDMSKVYEAHVKIIDKYDNADEIHYASPISLKQIKLLLSYIDRLEEENKILRKNEKHNFKVFDEVNWENQRLKKQKADVVKGLKDLRQLIDYLESKGDE